ncbi:MAG: (Fe-S)-binding protein [Bacteroidota bacterium]
MNFDPFVIPFSTGALILFAILLARYAMWIVKIPRPDQHKAWKGLFSLKLFRSVWEVFRESLIHRNIFRINKMLGWMHMSFAFGWFLLIAFGTMESKFHKHKVFNMPYDPIFLRYFEHDVHGFRFAEGFTTIMDMLLLLLLTATFFALIKRIYSRLFGMKKTTKLLPGDKIALYSLWLIFPMRFLAESFTAGLYNNGGFLTQSTGNVFAATLPLEYLEYPAWWAYSSALCMFFLFLPFSRYMHIPTEIFLISLRNCGIRTDTKITGYSEFEIYSCSRCGICIDKCQMSKVTGKQMQAVYFLQDIRRNILADKMVYDCMLCGRCKQYCPVGIDITRHRQMRRLEFAPVNGFYFKYLEDKIPMTPVQYDIAYFAGCMTHLTPNVKNAMLRLMKNAGEKFIFLDREGSICCGRPLMLAGNDRQAKSLMYENKKLIRQSGAKILVTSCPICYRTFKNDYGLDIEVMHHSRYLLKLAINGKLQLKMSDRKVVYHDPCELGRGMNEYDDPRELIMKIAELSATSEERQGAVCCGGSLADFISSAEQKNTVRDNSLKILCENNPDEIITACPLCKKTFFCGTEVPVRDIAELAVDNMNNLQ